MTDLSSYFASRSILWLWIPLCFIVMQAVLEVILPADILVTMHNENGTHEILQFLIMAFAFGLGVQILAKGRRDISAPLKLWVGLATLCSLYVAGEEISWGQHIFEWATPEAWHTINDQQETNLHNTSSWFDQKPRLILLIGSIVGGVIIPLLAKFKPASLPAKFNAIYPEGYLGLTALLGFSIKMAEKIGEAYDIVLFSRASEVEELYLFYFVLLYMLMLRKRLTA